MVTTKIYSSTSTHTQQALLEIGVMIRRDNFEADCALAFSSIHHATHGQHLNEALSDVLGNAPFLGWLGTSVYHKDLIPEWQPALTVMAFKNIQAHVRCAAHEELGSHLGISLLADSPMGTMRFLAANGDGLEPYGLLSTLDEQLIPVAGAVSLSPKNLPGMLICSDQQKDAPLGAAIATFSDLKMTTALAQGTQILGEKHRVTAAEDNMLIELDTDTALEVLLQELSKEQRDNLRHLGGKLFAGLATPDGESWLMRPVIGIDPDSGILIIGDNCTEDTELAFFVRDAHAARRNIQDAALHLKEQLDQQDPLAIIIFNCTGRDEAFLGKPLFDIETIKAAFPKTQYLAGVAGGGEFCTVGNNSHLFQYCSVVVALTEQSSTS